MSFLEDLYLGPEVRIGIYYINTRHKQEHIVSEFKRRLKRIYGEIDSSGPPGRKMAERDSLNMLGASRLRKHCPSLPNAQETVAKLVDNGSRMSYKDRREWNRACGSAVTRFRSILGLPSSEFPLCHTKGWQ
jgi:hypothetical protein